MHKPTDEELIEEIRRRFEFNRKALDDMRAMTRKLEQVNEKLQESEALKSQFLSNIRNEINNPLSAIMGLAAQFFDRFDNRIDQQHEILFQLFGDPRLRAV